ncbi:phosphotransferase family protein [Pseudoduganella namucuonensis]|uniref:Predicted kinase, aminoglycoside phosphotransferase (APT) family n=1 Tax=Pseudoduganella namucuonensis TaxID=1035707 RepID=A0A1I7LSG8_9BURK|nr:phosphotransferase family protein [Pseudoduganella namucuonensis]SFV12651.1 Predicted kinase, aminoglycoside phosphotransferase (APT) family [Pseudoduganella namucuonensis]
MQATEQAPGLNVAALDRHLRIALPGLAGQMAAERIAGGQSNPTFFITYDNRRMVLRKQPLNVLPSAHAIDREYRVMSALRGGAVPVPDTILYCADAAVIGTPFYLMERIEGRVFADCALPGVAPAERRAMYLAMADTLAALHRVDPAAVGLADYGKRGDYFTRQLARWSRQWESAKTRDVPELARLLEWLPAHVPGSELSAISHGDFRIGNLMFHPTEPRVVGVLDWELSTLGHPLADVAYSALAWRLLPGEYMGMRGADLTALGIPAEEEYLSRYYSQAGHGERATAFHTAFALFRLAVIFEGIAARARAGLAASEDGAEVGKLGVAFARRAIEVIDNASDQDNAASSAGRNP